MAKHILFHRPTPWDSELNCSTKTYTRLFAQRGYRVTYLQSTINLGHRLLRKGYYHTWKKGPRRVEHGIWVTGAMSLVPHIDNRSAALARFSGPASYRTALPSIRSLVHAAGYGDPDIIWTTVPGSTSLKSIFPKARLLFHVVDNYSAYRGGGVRALEALDYQRADHLLVIGQALKEYLTQGFGVSPEQVTNLGQGVNLALYAGDFTVPPELKAIPRPRAVWLGLGKKLDRGLLGALAKSLQQKQGSLIWIGPEAPWTEEFGREYPNMHFLGPRPAPDVPAYLRSCDLGVMLYDRSKQAIYEGQHPLKLYEYAAAGLPIISTHHREFEVLKPPVWEVSNEAEIESMVPEILAASKESDRMKAFAAEHSWSACADRAEAKF